MAIEVPRLPAEREAARLRALEACGVHREEQDRTLSELAGLAAAALQAPIGLVSLVDDRTQWLPGRFGLTTASSARDGSFCAWSVASPDELLIVPDARADPRFADDPAVRDELGVRFYAGAPFRSPEGEALGSLCVIDHVPRHGLDPRERALLTGLALQVERHLRSLADHLALDRLHAASVAAEEVAGLGSMRVDLVTGSWSWSPGLYALYGLDACEVAPSFAADRATYPTVAEHAAATTAVEELIARGGTGTLERRVRRPDGTMLTCRGRGEVEVDASGRAVAFTGTLVDVTDLARAHEELAQQNAFREATLEHMTEGLVACDAEGRLTVFNAASRRLHGIDAVVGLEPGAWARTYDLVDEHGRTLASDRIPLARALAGEDVRDAPLTIARPDRPAVHVTCNGRQLRDVRGRLLGALVTMTDVTARRAAEARLRADATRDPVTGLVNRASFDRELREVLDGPAAETCGVVFLDLDGFKLVNDTHGHEVGDLILRAVADVLLERLRPGDVLARWGGDEFTVLCRRATPADLGVIARRLRRTFERPLPTEVGAIPLDISVGTAHAREVPTGDADALLRWADRAMYRDKGRRRGTPQRPPGAGATRGMRPADGGTEDPGARTPATAR